MYSWDRAVAALPPPERQRSQRACTLRRGRAGLEVAKTGIVPMMGFRKNRNKPFRFQLEGNRKSNRILAVITFDTKLDSGPFYAS